MDSHANDVIRLWQKLSFQITQGNTVYIDWNCKPTCTPSSVKAQNFQEISHFQSEGAFFEWQLVINCPVYCVNPVMEKFSSISLLRSCKMP